MLVFFTNLDLVEFQVRYLVLFLLFLVMSDLGWFWAGHLHKNIQLMWDFLKAPFSVLHFSYYLPGMTLYVILLSMLMILLSTLDVIRHLICGNNYNWLLNFNLIYKTLWTGARSGLFISMLEKVNWFHLNSLITLVVLMWKWIGLFLRKNYLSRCWCWLSLLNWVGALLHYLTAKDASKKIGDLIHYMKFLSPEVALYLYKSIKQPCIEYCCHFWAGAPSCYLELLDKLQIHICRTVGPWLAASLESLAHH